jgi:PAP2 superfamily
MTICDIASTARSSRAARAPGRARPRAQVELALLTLLYVGYSVGRLLGHAGLPAATAHARDLLHLEALLHLNIERHANELLEGVPTLALIGSYWYALLHYIVTPAVLLWAYRARPLHYRRVRNALVLASAIGLVGFTMIPMAPPRMLPGYVDTLATTAQHGWWGGDASAPRGLGALTNQFAAMPSLHVGWALWCAWVVVTLTSRRWVRIAAIAYPIGTTLVVVGTANHYVLDAVAGMLVMLLAIHVAGRLPQVVPLPEQRRERVEGKVETGSLGQAA